MKRSTSTGGPAALSSGATGTVAIRMTTTMRGIVTPEAVVLDLETAGIASRGLARALDAAIQGVLMLVLVLVAGGLFGVSGILAIVLVGGGLAVVIPGYPLICEVAPRISDERGGGDKGG